MEENRKSVGPIIYRNLVSEKSWDNSPKSKLTQNNHQTDQRFRGEKHKVTREEMGKCFKISEGERRVLLKHDMQAEVEGGNFLNHFFKQN